MTLEILRDILLQRQSDSARKPALSCPTGPMARDDQIRADGY